MREYGIPAVERSRFIDVTNHYAFLPNGGVAIERMDIQISYLDGDDRKKLNHELGEFLYTEIRRCEFDSLSERKRKKIGVDNVKDYDPDCEIPHEVNALDEDSPTESLVRVWFDDHVRVKWREELSPKIINFVANYYSDLKNREIELREKALTRVKEFVMDELDILY